MRNSIFNLKELLLGLSLIFLLSIVGFLYRNVMERNVSYVGEEMSCLSDIKKCPDGTLVRRVGPICSFAQCSVGNISLPDLGIIFTLPDGYTLVSTSTEQSSFLRVAYSSASTTKSMASSTIEIYEYSVASNETPRQVMLRENQKSNLEKSLKNIDTFANLTVGSRSFERVVARSDREVVTSYYLLRNHNVLCFKSVYKNIVNNKSAKKVTELNGQKKLRDLLKTLKISFL